MTEDVRYYFVDDKRYTQIAKWIIDTDKRLINNTLTVQEKTGKSTKGYQYFYNNLPKVNDEGLRKNLVNTFELDGRNAVTKKLYNKVFASRLHYDEKTRESPNRRHLNDFF